MSKIILAIDRSFVRLSHNMAALILAAASNLVFYEVFTHFIIGEAAV